MSLTLRAILAVLLTVVFYALAIGIAASLLWQTAGALFLDRGHFNFLRPVVAVFILWGVFPWREKFVAPGLKVAPEEHPGLWAEVSRTAEATGQPVPAEVYLVPDFNAFVMERDGGLFTPGPRVLGIGLPLLRSLTVSEFRSVLAHEFGHYASGDTRLGAWIYRTGNAIERVLASPGHWAVQLLFGAYGKMFQWITAAISRRQEYAADETAARVAGPASALKALCKIESGATLYSFYWATDVELLLVAGYLPPLRAGYERFLAGEGVRRAREAMAEQEHRAHALDSHPATAERLAAIERLGLPAGAESQSRLAASLLGDGDGETLERRVILALAPGPMTDSSWDEGYAAALPPNWAAAVRHYRRALVKLTPSRLPDVARKPAIAARRWAFLRSDVTTLNRKNEKEIAINAVGPALALALFNAGWRIETAPGDPLALTKDGMRIEPFDVLSALMEKRMEPAEWLRTVEVAGLTGIDLGRAADRWPKRDTAAG